MLYAIYAESVFSPYISFRIAFALALNVAERAPSLACDLVFEGLYVVLEVIPRMLSIPQVRAALLFFAELLERTDRYYFAALVLDVYTVADPGDASASKAIGQLCSRNGDGARAMFHFAEAIRALAAAGQFEEAVFVARLMCARLEQRGLLDDAIGLLCAMLNTTFKIPIVARSVSREAGLDRTLPAVRPKRARARRDTVSARTVAAQTAGVALAGLFAKAGYFALALKLLAELRTVAESALFRLLVEFITAKVHLLSNRFDAFCTILPPVDVRGVQSLASSATALFNARTFDVAFASLKLLARGFLDRGLFSKALFWAEAMVNAVQAAAPREVGRAHFLRGCALAEALWQNAGCTEGIVVTEECDTAMSRVAKSFPQRELSRREILAEALASFEAARASQRRVGGIFLLLQASLAYVALLLQYFLGGDRETIVIGNPQLITQPAVGNLRRSLTSEVRITEDSAPTHIGDVLSAIEKTAAMAMHPTMIIASQVAFARLHLQTQKMTAAKTKIDFALQNLDRYFMCAGQFIARDLSLGKLKGFKHLLLDLCDAVLRMDAEFINERLVIFDMLASIETLYANSLRLVVEDNSDPVEAGYRLRSTTVAALASDRTPDLFPVLSQIGFFDRRSAQGIGSDDTISKLLGLIRANIRCSEQQSLEETTLTNMNRGLCQRIRNCADAYRTSHPGQSAGELSWNAISMAAPMAANTVFVQRMIDSIVVYVPRTGQIRRLSLSMPPAPLKFSVYAARNEVIVSLKASLFSTDFSALIAMFLMTDKKLKHSNFSPTAAREICEAAKTALFGDIGNDVPRRPTTPDDGSYGERASFFTRQRKGQLVSIEASFTPIIIAASATLRGLPYELMFPEHLVLRCVRFRHLLLPCPPEMPPPKPAVFRWHGEPTRLMDIAIRRSFEEIYRVVHAYSPSPQMKLFVDELERSLPFPMALFSSNADTLKYTARYPFCTVFNISTKWSPNADCGLFVFSYSDLSEMSAIVDRSIRSCPLSFFMFIPCQFVREAFTLMIDIFERQVARQQSKRDCDVKVSKRAYDFVTLLQGTIQATLGCPIPLIAPLPSPSDIVSWKNPP
jgi:hypothetical protein